MASLLPDIHCASGYLGFHPPRVKQDEEVLTETNVKNGLVLPLAVPVSYHSEIRAG